MQDTLLASPPIKGVVIENGIVTETVGFEGTNIKSTRFVVAFMEGFLACQRYLAVNTTEKKGGVYE